MSTFSLQLWDEARGAAVILGKKNNATPNKADGAKLDFECRINILMIPGHRDVDRYLREDRRDAFLLQCLRVQDCQQHDHYFDTTTTWE